MNTYYAPRADCHQSRETKLLHFLFVEDLLKRHIFLMFIYEY